MKANDGRKVKNEVVKNRAATYTIVSVTDKRIVAKANVEAAKNAVNKYRQLPANH